MSIATYLRSASDEALRNLDAKLRVSTESLSPTGVYVLGEIYVSVGDLHRTLYRLDQERKRRSADRLANPVERPSFRRMDPVINPLTGKPVTFGPFPPIHIVSDAIGLPDVNVSLRSNDGLSRTFEATVTIKSTISICISNDVNDGKRCYELAGDTLRRSILAYMFKYLEDNDSVDLELALDEERRDGAREGWDRSIIS